METAKVFEPADSSLVTLYQNVNCVTGSVAINDEFHDMFVSINGRLEGPLPGGRYSLDPGFSPFFPRLRTFATGGQKPINVSIFYVSKRNFSLPWGTGEMLCNEKILGVPYPIRLAAGGNLFFKVFDSRQFLRSLVGLQGFDVGDLESGTRALILPVIRDSVMTRMQAMNFVEAQNDLVGLSNSVTAPIADALREFGLAVSRFSVVCLNVAEDDRERIQDIHGKRIVKAVDLEAVSNEVSALYGGDIRERARLLALQNFSQNPGAAPIADMALFPALWKAGERIGDSFEDFIPPRRPPHIVNECPDCHHDLDRTYPFCPYCGHRF